MPDGNTAEGVTDGEGNFEVDLPEGTNLVPGDEITVVATDEAGNTSSTEFNLVIERNSNGLGTTTGGSDSGKQSGLPPTGESKSFITNLLGMTSAAMGVALLAWNKRKDELKKKMKKK